VKDKYGTQRETKVSVHVMPSVLICEVLLPVLLDLRAGEGKKLKEKINDGLYAILQEHFEIERSQDGSL